MANRIWPLGLLALALALLYGPFVLSGGLLAVGDGLGYYFPVRVLAAQSLLAGELPFWNPANFAGVPLHGMLQAGVFFPGNWGFLFLPPVAAMNLAVLASSLIAGISMFAFTRALGVARLPALVAALPYMIAGYLGAHLEQLTSVQVVSLIPAILWAIERFRQTENPRFVQAACAIYALQLLAGYPQTCLVTLVIAAAYGWHRGRDLEPARWRPYMAQLALAGGLGLGIAAVELLPVIDVIAGSQRMNLSYDEVTSHSVPPRHLPTLAFPFMFGGGIGELFRVPYWGAGPYYIEILGYVGLAPLMLAIAALLAWRTDRQVRFWALFGLVGLVLALGASTPIYHVWAQIPVLRSIRVPGRHLLEVDLAICVLAALGLQAVLTADPARRKRLVLVGAAALGLPMAAVLAGVGLGRGFLVARLTPWLPAGFDLTGALALTQPAFWVPVLLFAASALALALLVRRPRLAPALLLVLYLDLLIFSRGQNWHVYGAYPGPLAMVPLQVPYRVMSVTLGIPMHHYELARALHAPLVCIFDGERSAGGYEAFVGTRYAKLLGGIDNMGLFHEGGPWSPANHMLDLLGVRTIYMDARAAGTPHDPGLQPPHWRRLPDQPFAQRWENPRALPMAWRPTEARVLPPDQVDAILTGAADFKPERQALLEAGAVPATLAAGSVVATRPSANRLEIDTTGAGPGLVMINEAYDPGWQALAASGEPLPLRRADGLLMAVDVPAGHQRFELHYRPPRWGLMLTMSLASLALLLFWALRGRRPHAPRTPT